MPFLSFSEGSLSGRGQLLIIDLTCLVELTLLDFVLSSLIVPV